MDISKFENLSSQYRYAEGVRRAAYQVFYKAKQDFEIAERKHQEAVADVLKIAKEIEKS